VSSNAESFEITPSYVASPVGTGFECSGGSPPEVLPAIRLPGSPLTEADFKTLDKSFISREAAERAMLRRVDSEEGRALVGRKGGGDYAGIVMPYFWPGDLYPREYRLRRDTPDVEYDSEGKMKSRAKYVSPPGRANLLYIPRETPLSWLSDENVAAFITEGEKKAIALDSLSRMSPFHTLTIALSGVWNFRGTVGKQSGPNGKSQDVKGVIPDFDKVAWKHRRVVIVFDANANSNPMVRSARSQLAWMLKGRGAHVHFVDLPAEEGVNGIDDLLGLHGP
jgi:hypothetical protein